MKNTNIARILILIFIMLACTAGVVQAQNYTVIMSYGQTPYQLGYLSKGNVTGWTWWDTDGAMQQKNVILVSIMENTTTISGLSPPTWIQDSSESYGPGSSWKAGNGTHSWHYLDNYSSLGTPLEDIVLSASMETPGFFTKIINWAQELITGVNPAAVVPTSNLTFWTKYNMTDNHGYVKVSVDRGATWDTLENYTGNSGVWVEKSIDLTEYSGQQVLLAFYFSSNSNNDDEWWIDDISLTSNGVEIILDDAEDSAPSVLSVDVSYPHYDYSSNSFSNKTVTVDLVEDYTHQIYYGVFVYPDDAYVGKYQMDFSTIVNSENLVASNSFNTTLWGCQARGCHDSWTSPSDPSTRNPTVTIHPDNITSDLSGNCLTMCHSTYSSQFLRATPIHLHDIEYGHLGGFVFGPSGWVTIYNSSNANLQMYYKSSVKRPLSQTQLNVSSHVTIAECTDCHTNFIHDNTGSDQHLIADTNILSGTNISSNGIHTTNVTCEDCHGGLSYPSIPPGQTSLAGTIGSYVPEFMSYESVTKTYIIDVDNSGTISVDVTGDDVNYGIFLSLIGPIDDVSGLQDLNTSDRWDGTYSVPSVDGIATFAKGSKIYYPSGDEFYGVTFDVSPKPGKWIARIFSRSPGTFNYTITSSHPIQEKPVIRIPWNCSECHNPDASGTLAGANTLKSIPSWDNNGLSYSHTDINGDGKDDITCRSCHDSMHDISIRDCNSCHIQRPGGHTMSNYFTMTYSECLGCHKEPHYEPESAAGGNCTDCHLEGGANVSAGLPMISDRFLTSVHNNITGDYDDSNYSAISMVCWGCHVNYTEQLIDPSHTKPVSELPSCEDCHFNNTPFNGIYLRKIPPIQIIEHQPMGEDIKTNISVGCIDCHNLTDMKVTGAPTTGTALYSVSHYAKNYTAISSLRSTTNTTDYCTSCHFNATSIFEPLIDTGGEHGDTCNQCHGVGTIHDANLSVPSMSGDSNVCLGCHNGLSNKRIISSEYTKSIHGTVSCTDCHTPRQEFRGIIVNQESLTYNFTMIPDIISLNATLVWKGGSTLGLTLHSPNGTNFSGNSINISSPQSGNWSAVVRDISGDAPFVLTINVTMKHGILMAKECNECHITGFGIAPFVFKHLPQQSNVPTDASCILCHESDIFSGTAMGSSHYAPKVTLDTKDCIQCHTGTVDGWGNAPDQRNHTNFAFVTKTLSADKPWELVDGYAITLIEATNSAAMLIIKKDGVLLQNDIVGLGNNFKYEISGLGIDDIAIINVTVDRLFVAKDRYVVDLSGYMLSSHIHRETQNEQCYSCHDSEYRKNMPDGMNYYVLDKDLENVTLMEMPVNFTGNDKKTIAMGDNWDLGEGYSIHVSDVSIEGNKARIQLYRNEILLEDEIVIASNYITHEETLLDRDINVFSAKVDGVFVGASKFKFVVLTNVDLIAGDQNILDGNFKLLQTATPAKYLTLDGSITVGGEPENFHAATVTPGVYSPDCISCHTGDGVAPILLDLDEFKQGVHVNLNNDTTYTSFITDDANKACWGCHGNSTGGEPDEHPTPYLGNHTPKSCITCHGSSLFGAKQIYSHYPGAEISTSGTCWDCHSNNQNNSDRKPQNAVASASHYSAKKNLLNTSDCAVCHGNETNATLWGNAPQVSKHNSSNNCALCHAGEGVKTFHDKGITIIRDCETCHVDKQQAEKFNLTPILTHYPGASDGKANTLINNDYTCRVCHNATNNSLHSGMEVREYQNESMGFCFQCHSKEGTFPHKSDTQLEKVRHGSGIKAVAGCDSCHTAEGVSKYHTPTALGKSYMRGTVKYDIECTECHPEHEGREYQPYEGIQCEDCHDEYGSAHYAGLTIGQSGISTSTCTLCHNEDADKFHELTHIVGNVSEEAYEPCSDCHDDIAALMEYSSSASILGGTMSTISQTVFSDALITCTSCHDSSGMNSFHYDAYPMGTVQDPGWENWTAGNVTKCKDCHTYQGGEPPFNATNMGTQGRSPAGTAHGLAPSCAICHGGADSISFHVLATSEFIPRIAATIDPAVVYSGEVSILQVTVVLPQLTKLTRAEYFIDEIGRDGDGLQLEYIVGKSNDSSVVLGAVIDTSILSYDKHPIFVHVKDSSGKWSKTEVVILTVERPGGIAAVEVILKDIIPVFAFAGLLFLIWRRFR
ncbi:MAG: S-layer protein domain-containing protein [Methanosarcinaceae archaeon]|nr:S-layer protein domain-containing protein [Methanosarcinaceae archaeon]